MRTENKREADVDPNPARRPRTPARDPRPLPQEILGRLDDDMRERLEGLYAAPTPTKWNDCHGIILAPSPGFGVSLWQALINVDPQNTPKVGPTFALGQEEPNWEWSPTRQAIHRAISNAARLTEEQDEHRSAQQSIRDL